MRKRSSSHVIGSATQQPEAEFAKVARHRRLDRPAVVDGCRRTGLLSRAVCEHVPVTNVVHRAWLRSRPAKSAISPHCACVMHDGARSSGIAVLAATPSRLSFAAPSTRLGRTPSQCARPSWPLVVIVDAVAALSASAHALVPNLASAEGVSQIAVADTAGFDSGGPR